jgi:phosphate transport system substrate-binding protein
VISHQLSVIRSCIAVLLFMIPFFQNAFANSPLRIVGSSAVFPFAATVAEHFHYKADAPTPLVEAIGTGAGIKLFCSDLKGPDGVMTSRQLTEGERAKCADHGITFEEFKIGQDGLIFIQNKRENAFSLTLREINRALAENVQEGTVCRPNPYKTWAKVNRTLPPEPIHVLGPAPTSGTYDVLVEKIKSPCGESLRRDGAYVEAPANENLIIQKVLNASHTIGIVTFGFYDQNRGGLNALPIEGVLPSVAAIQSGAYPLSRSLYLYVKTNEINPTRAAYAKEFVSKEAVEYLSDKGLIPLSLAEQAEGRRRAQQLAR